MDVFNLNILIFLIDLCIYFGTEGLQYIKLKIVYEIEIALLVIIVVFQKEK